MLPQKYYHTLLGIFIFTGVPVCGASGNIKYGLRKIKERAAPDHSTSSHKQRVLEIEKRQDVNTGIDTGLGPVTDITTEFDTIIITQSPLAPVTVTSISTAPPPTRSTTSSSTPSTSPTTSPTTSQQPATATPKPLCDIGYSLCAAEYNGGCCKNGFTCAIDRCIPPATETGAQRTCGPQSFLCPASLNYGCCPNSFECGATECLSRITATITATSTVGGITYTGLTTASYTTAGKVAESDIYAKQATRASINPTPSMTESPVGSDVPLSGIAIGGIVAGCVIGILVFFLVGWCTYRRLGHRGNNDPPGGVPTTNFFDPNLPIARTPGSGSARYQPVTQEQSYFPKQPTIPILNYSHPTQHVHRPPEGVAEMAAGPMPYTHGNNWWGDGQVPQGGLKPEDNRPAVYEVEGTTPAGGGRGAKRWSKRWH